MLKWSSSRCQRKKTLHHRTLNTGVCIADPNKLWQRIVLCALLLLLNPLAALLVAVGKAEDARASGWLSARESSGVETTVCGQSEIGRERRRRAGDDGDAGDRKGRVNNPWSTSDGPLKRHSPDSKAPFLNVPTNLNNSLN
jgi:hypothetical protein